jgi:alpha-L-fucosidase
MKRLFVYMILAVIAFDISAQTAGDEDKEMFNRAKQRDQQAIDEAIKGWWTASMKTQEQRIAWWREAKFGMFIHWGLYSVPGGEWKGKKVSGYAEHLMRKEKISRNDYLNLAHQFNPQQFNAEQWILHAKNAGTKYFIITAKHHDGFVLYDSKVSDFDIIDQTPFKRDPMAELAAAAKKQGIKFGFYYSHAFDWEHPDAPGNDWEYNNPGGDKLIGGANWYDTYPEWLPKAIRYVDEKAIPQIKELLTKYHPDILWFDTPHKLPLSENIRILKAIRETDSNVVVNGRLVRNAAANFGDYKNTADRPAEFYPVTGDWEAIPTTNESYGYHQYDSSHKPVSHFIQLLASAASKGGNLLMNIGPKGNGSFDAKDRAILNGIGEWMDKNGESIYGTVASPLPLQSWGVSTLKGNKLYLHVFNWPPDGKLYIGGLLSAPRKVRQLTDATKNYSIKRGVGSDFSITVPTKAPDSINTVLVLELEDELKTHPARLLAPNSKSDRFLAFDAKQNGKGFSYGDGKTNRYYVEGWKSKAQSLSWEFNTIRPASYKIRIRYLAPAVSAGGSYELFLFKNSVKTTKLESSHQYVVETDEKNTTVITKDLDVFSIGSGSHILMINPVSISGSELMKLLEIQLTPIDKK